MALPAFQVALGALLESFSRSVRQFIDGVAEPEATAWQIADAFMRTHPDYCRSELLPLADRPGRSQSYARWLLQIRTLFDLDAVRASPVGVIDGRMTLLALARLEPELDRAFGRAGFRARLERELGAPPARVFRTW